MPTDITFDTTLPILELCNIEQSYRQADKFLPILKGIDLKIMPGEIVALTGASGVGKSTLLHIAGLLEPATSGDILINGIATASLDDNKRTTLRRQDIGFVYQFHHLLPEFTALENVMLPQMIAGVGQRNAQARAQDLLASFMLSERAYHTPAKLSGGEQQRVAILRAVANRPRLLLADEPTGNLDEDTALVVLTALIDLVRSQRMGALIATHDLHLAAQMDRTLKLTNGLLSDTTITKPYPTGA